MRSPEQIVDLFRQRRAANPLRQVALQVRDVANGDYGSLVLPMPELAPGQEKLAVANTLLTGLDGSAQRISSSPFNVSSQALKHGQPKSEEYAAIRRRAGLGWMDLSKIRRRMPRRARHILAYASSPVMIRPDRKLRIPRWQVRDPLTAYPAPTADLDDVAPPDCVFAVQRTLRWLRDNYPEKIGLLDVGKNAADGDMFDLLEYVDEEQITLLVIGRQRSTEPRGYSGMYSGVGKQMISWSASDDNFSLQEIVVLEQLENRAGRCTVVCPWRVTLDQPAGQYDNVIGKLWWQARLSALELIAVERAIYPSEWVVFPSGGDGKILVEANGRAGTIGEIEGGEYHVTNVTPGYKTTEAMDRLERAQRLDGKTPAEYGGESPTNIRTDRRGLSVFGNAVDFNHAEIQGQFEWSLEVELEVAAAVDIGYFDEAKSFHVNWKGARGPVDYKPSTHFEEGSKLAVRYSAVGVDADTNNQVNMQKVGAGVLSRPTMMEQDPSVEDVEEELERIDVDQLRFALREGVKARSASGELPEVDLARAIELRLTGLSLEAAVAQAHREAQERQAAGAPAGSPEGQSGLANPGAGAEAGGGGEVLPSDLASLLGGLRVPGRTAAVA